MGARDPRPGGVLAALVCGLILLVQGGDACVQARYPGAVRAGGTGGGAWAWGGGLTRGPWSLADDYRCLGCNVVLISIDTLRADHVGFNGYPRPTTPRLDEFAAQAVNFRTAIAQAASTLPSHASMFTSLLPHQHGALHSRKTPLSDEAETLAEILKAAGYTTVAFTAGAQLNPIYNVQQGFDVYQSERGDATHETRFSSKVEQAIGWLERNPDAKFFLFLHTYEVHTPYTPKPEYMEIFDAGYDGPMADEVVVDTLRQINMNFRRINSADLQHIVNAYDAEIRSVDAAFAELIDYLRAAGLYDDTLILFTSDHGEEFGEHGTVGWHALTLYDELLRIPLLVKFPRSAFAGLEVRDQVTTLDFLPTILDVVDVPRGNRHFEGVSLVDVLRGEAGTTYAVSQRDKELEPLPTSVRTLRWKLMDIGEDVVERRALFDLVVDPGETVDVSDRHPWVLESLERNLARILSRTGLEPVEAIELDDELVRQLRALGYIQ